MDHKTCLMCSLLRQVCVHDPGQTTIQCWQGKHSGTCSSYCQCDCHQGAYPLNQVIPHVSQCPYCLVSLESQCPWHQTPQPVSQAEVDAAIASIQEVRK